MTDLQSLSYADLLANLRSDLQLDGAADLLPGSLITALLTPATLATLAAKTARALAVSFGVGTVNFTTGNQLTAAVAVPHGLGRTPAFSIGQIIVTGAAYWVLQDVADATNLHFQGYTTTTPGANFGEPFVWLAIG